MYLLDSFIELVPAVSKKSADHYVVFKKVCDIWLSLDNTEVKKANTSGMFRVNLAFYRNINTSHCVEYNLDFAEIKQGCARRCPPLLVKFHPKYLANKGKGKKSSDKPQLSIPDDALKEINTEDGNVEDEVSTGDKQDIIPKSSETTLPDIMSENASAALTSVDSQLKINVNEASEDQPGTVPTGEPSSSNSRKNSQEPQTVCDKHATFESSADNVQTKSTEVETVSAETATLESSGDNVETEIEKQSEIKETEENTHTKALPANPSKDQPSIFDENPKQKGGCTAAEMAPLEFKKRLFVDIERYPNLLKRYQKGKVKVHVSCTEDERLNRIKEKVISSTESNKYLSETVDETNKVQKPIILSTPAAAVTSDDDSSGSSGEDGDDSETDPNYNPTKDVDDEDMPSKPKKAKTKDDGNNTCMLAFYNSVFFGIPIFTHFLYNNYPVFTGMGQCKISSTRSTPQMTRRVTGLGRKKPTNKGEIDKYKFMNYLIYTSLEDFSLLHVHTVHYCIHL